MSARTVESGYFGSLGHGDPECAFTEKTIVTSWDFAKKNVPENKTIPLVQIPKGFCIDRITVVQKDYADQSVGLTFGLKSDDSFTIGSTFTLVASSTKLRSSQAADGGSVTKTSAAVYVASTSAGSPTTSVQPVTGVTAAGPVFVSDDDVLCMIVPDGLTGDKCAAGSFDLALHGFSTFAEAPAENKTGNAVFRPTMQTVDNVAGPRFPND